MSPIEELYRDFCERIAEQCEAEAALYENHPELNDSDRQFVVALRERARRFQLEVRRLDASYHA